MQNITVKITKGRQLKACLRPGIQGQKGADGLQGIQGPQGLQGVKGDKGNAGDSGIVFAESPLEYNSETKTIQVASGYIIPAQNALDNKVDKVNGKGLSANDLTDDLKSNYDTAYISLGNIQTALTAILGV